MSLQAHDRQLQGVLGLPSTPILLLPNFHLGKTLFIPVDTIVSHACTPFPLKPTSVRHVPPPHHQNHRTVRTPQTPQLWARPSTCSPAVPSHPSTGPAGPRPPASPDPHLAGHVPQAAHHGDTGCLARGLQGHPGASRVPPAPRTRPPLHTLQGPRPRPARLAPRRSSSTEPVVFP